MLALSSLAAPIDIAQSESMRATELIPFSQARPPTFSALLCDGVTARNLRSFAELLALYDRLQAERPQYRVLASLDDLGQASYTSGHGTDAYGLDNIEGHDLSGLGPSAFEDGDHLGYLSTPEEFPIRLANLLELAGKVGLGDLLAVLEWATPGDRNDLLTINGDPEDALRISGEEEVIFQFVPVARAAETLAAFPNGYFSCDLSPVQNYALAGHLEAKYALRLFGIGARFLGFCREEPFAADTARQLAEELAAVYANTPSDAAEALGQLLIGRRWILLRYTES